MSACFPNSPYTTSLLLLPLILRGHLPVRRGGPQDSRWTDHRYQVCGVDSALLQWLPTWIAVNEHRTMTCQKCEAIVGDITSPA